MYSDLCGRSRCSRNVQISKRLRPHGEVMKSSVVCSNEARERGNKLRPGSAACQVLTAVPHPDHNNICNNITIGMETQRARTKV